MKYDIINLQYLTLTVVVVTVHSLVVSSGLNVDSVEVVLLSSEGSSANVTGTTSLRSIATGLVNSTPPPPSQSELAARRRMEIVVSITYI